MIEMSNMTDRDQSFSLRQIELAMAMICALGADIITSYYGEELFGEEEYRRFADYTARLCQTLDGGRHVPQALLYYPFEQMASLTPPQAKQMPKAALELERELIRINEALLSRQVDYDFVNRDLLLKCRFEGGRIITASGEAAASLVFPPVSFVDEEVAGLIGRAAAAGVRVIFGGERRKIRGLDSCAGVLFEKECGLPASGDLMVENEPELTYIHKSFERQQVYLLVNTGREDIRKKAGVPAFGKRLLLLDPDRGTCEEAAARIADGRAEFDLILPAMTACMLVLE
jgi:hypothetical protein